MPSSCELEFSELRVFRKDIKRLSKKYRTLKDDLKTFESVLRLAHEKSDLRPEDLGCFPVANLSEHIEGVFIAKKFACMALKGTGVRSGIRIVYRFNRIDLRIEFIEAFHKNEKPLEDRDRIENLYRCD